MWNLSNRIKDAKISQKGQITVPKEVRDKLCVKPGDRIIFYFDENEEIKISSTDNTKVVLKDQERKVTIDRIISNR